MKQKKQLSWLLNLPTKKLYSLNHRSNSISLTNKLINEEKNTFLIDSNNSIISKPFVYTNRSLMNTDVHIVDHMEKKKKMKDFFSFHENHQKINKMRKNYVKLHALGYKTQANDDFFKHYYRLLLTNAWLLMRKNEKYNTFHIMLEKEEFINKKLEYLPIDLKLFFLDKAKQDIEFLDKIVEMYEKNPSFRNLQDQKKTAKAPPILNPSSSSTVNQVFLTINEKFINKFDEKLFKEDEFIKVFIKKIKKFGLDIINQDELEALKKVINYRKDLISSIFKEIIKNDENIKNEENRESLKKSQETLKHDKSSIKSSILNEKNSILRSLLLNQPSRFSDFNEDLTDLALKKTSIASKSLRTLKNPNLNSKAQESYQIIEKKAFFNKLNRKYSQNIILAKISEPITKKNRSKTEHKFTYNPDKIDDIPVYDPEIALQLKMLQSGKASSTYISDFSMESKGFLNNLLERQEKKNEAILSRIRSKTGVTDKKVRIIEHNKVRKLKSLPYEEDLEVIKEDIEDMGRLLVEIEVLENRRKSKTKEEIMVDNIDDFIGKAEMLEKRIRDNVNFMDNNQFVNEKNAELLEEIQRYEEYKLKFKELQRNLNEKSQLSDFEKKKNPRFLDKRIENSENTVFSYKNEENNEKSHFSSKNQENLENLNVSSKNLENTHFSIKNQEFVENSNKESNLNIEKPHLIEKSIRNVSISENIIEKIQKDQIKPQYKSSKSSPNLLKSLSFSASPSKINKKTENFGRNLKKSKTIMEKVTNKAIFPQIMKFSTPEEKAIEIRKFHRNLRNDRKNKTFLPKNTDFRSLSPVKSSIIKKKQRNQKPNKTMIIPKILEPQLENASNEENSSKILLKSQNSSRNLLLTKQNSRILLKTPENRLKKDRSRTNLLKLERSPFSKNYDLDDELSLALMELEVK